jgi:hypothetical protein
MKSSGMRTYAFFVAILLLGLFVSRNAHLNGDVEEYVLMTVAFAEHQSPEIRLSDIEKAQHYLPVYREMLQHSYDGIVQELDRPTPGFKRGLNQKTYAIHFFAYSALAAIPFKVFEQIGIAPFQCFYFLNLSLILILACVLYRFFSSAWKASLALTLFMLSGAYNYLSWSNPEILSGVTLCAGLLFFFMRSYLFAGLMIGVAASQNPPIIFSLVFAPSLLFVKDYQAQFSLLKNLQSFITLRMVLGLGIGSLGVLLPMAFNMSIFGVPNIIASLATDRNLIGGERLFSYFFDLNQGMVIAIPGLALGLVLYAMFFAKDKIRALFLLCLCILFSLSLAIPALAAPNWNSGAQGMMRYVFWGGLPFIFLAWIFMQSHQEKNKYLMLLIFGVLASQASCTYSSLRYPYFQFSPVARWFMLHAPQLINPEPEIFVERSLGRDGVNLDVNQLYVFPTQGKPTKQLFHPLNPRLEELLCGKNKMLNTKTVVVRDGWHYLNSAPKCSKVEYFSAKEFDQSTELKFNAGWSIVEWGGGEWDGRWSDAANSSLTFNFTAQRKIYGIRLLGHYYQTKEKTRVYINDKDLGWHDLSQHPELPFSGEFQQLNLKLVHQTPHLAPSTPTFPKGRHLSLFLQSITIY